MSGDYSRIDFDPLSDYSGVLLQQGRPLTDRDWNDQVAATSRRLRAGTVDTSGPALVSAVTADAFKIVSDGAGGFVIKPGRIYVDGLLADNHGTGALQWDPQLAELRGKDPWPYATQPYLPNPPALPTSGTQVVFLDVWEREVTQFIDPNIVEKALGVDTTTRVQTVWQVKVLDPGATVDCATPLDNNKAWTAATAPSAGRLTTTTGDVPGDTNPCIIPPTGGYKGLENQLYRIEIHKKGPLGTATFKWSRDNGSVETRVTTIIDLSHIVVESIGKDAVLGFADGDWIEITDDTRELNGLAGEMRKIKVGGGIEAATRTITIEPPLLSGQFPMGDADPKRHIRVRRWDQKGKVLDKDGKVFADLDAAGGTILVPTGGTKILLENGVLASFDVAAPGTEFHVGDYWTFAARTSDASIELLDKAPPRGIHHHYLKLAVFTPPSGIEDCRPTGEDACCCTVTVAVGEDIQAAIDKLPDGGGCVCLKAGVHTVGKTIVIARHNIKLVGESIGAVVRINASEPALLIQGADGAAVSTVHFVRMKQGAASAVVVANGATRSTITDCQVEDAPAAAAAPGAAQSIGIQAIDCVSVTVARCTIASVMIGIMASGSKSADLAFEGNDINLTAQGATGTASTGLAGIVVQDVFGFCQIVNNSIAGGIAGIVVNDDMTGPPSSDIHGAVVSRNQVTCVPAPASADAQAVAIDFAGDFSVISENVVALLGSSGAHVGIRVTGSGNQVVENQLAPLFEDTRSGLIGIQIGYTDGNHSVLATGTRVSGNVVVAYLVGIAAVTTINTVVEGNSVNLEAGAEGQADVFGVFLYANLAARVHGNWIARCGIGVASAAGLGNRIAANTISNSAFGITAGQELGPCIAENRVMNMVDWGISCVQAFARCEIIENRLTNCGSASGIGIAAVLAVGELHIEANEVMNTGLAADGTPVATPALGIVGLGVLESRVQGNLVTYSDVTKRPAGLEDRALWLMGLYDYRIEYRFAGGSVDQSLGFAVQIVDNKFVGTGQSALVELAEFKWLDVATDNLSISFYSRFERAFFSNNYCMHFTGAADAAALAAPPPQGATVVLRGRAATVMGNQIRAAAAPLSAAPGYLTLHNYSSVAFNGVPGPCIGNVTSGPIVNRGAAPPLDPSFNMLF